MSTANMLALVFACVVFLNMQSTTLAQNSNQDYLDAHNAARSAVGVAGITWNNTVQAYAQNYANKRKSDCSLIHSRGPYSENIANSSSTSFPAKGAVQLWVAEKQYYNYNSNTCASGKECGHYKNVVCRKSTQVGCARVVCNNNAGVFIICNYYPPRSDDGRPY